MLHIISVPTRYDTTQDCNKHLMFLVERPAVHLRIVKYSVNTQIPKLHQDTLLAETSVSLSPMKTHLGDMGISLLQTH